MTLCIIEFLVKGKEKRKGKRVRIFSPLLILLSKTEKKSETKGIHMDFGSKGKRIFLYKLFIYNYN